MSAPVRKRLSGIFFVAMIATSASTLAADDSLAALIAAASRGGDYRPAPAQELDAAQRLLAHLLAGDPVSAAPLAAPHGLALHRVTSPAAIALVEDGSARRGRPVVAVRAAGAPVLLQIPHAFKDEMTREIGLRLFEESRARLAMWNTVPRHYLRGGVSVDADMAHLPQTWFTALATAFARTFPAGRIVQLHGFAANKRKSAAGGAADMVVSNGSTTPGAALRQTVACLGKGLKAEVRLYPDTVRELGGTTNAQVAALRSAGFAGFIHVEINRPLRERLLTDAAARRTLIDCLIDTP